MRRILALAASAGLAVLVVSGCSDDEPATTSRSGFDAGAFDASPPATSPPRSDAGAVGSADAAFDAAPTCPIGLDATVDATLKITTDDHYALYVNGALVDDVERLWSSPQTYALKLHRHPSRKNVVAVEGKNTAKIDGIDRTILADLSFDAGAGVQTVVSDASWRVGTALATGWFGLDFAETGWSAAVEAGAHGIAPYGSVLGTSTAKLIWSYLPDGVAASKPDQETIYARRTFYIDVAGAVAAAPATCP